MPEELLEEEGEGAEMAGGGLGLGEGQGEKDVSDQIESQDQLEDAKKPGEHDKEEDKDCKVTVRCFSSSVTDEKVRETLEIYCLKN